MAIKVDDPTDIQGAVEDRFNDLTSSKDLQDFENQMDDRYGDDFKKLDNNLGEAANKGEQTNGTWANNTTPAYGKNKNKRENFLQKGKVFLKKRGAIAGIVALLGGGAAVPFVATASLPFSIAGNMDARSFLQGLTKYNDDYLGFKYFGKTSTVSASGDKIKGLTADEIKQLKESGVEFRGGEINKVTGKTTYTHVKMKGGSWISADNFAAEMRTNPAFRKAMRFTRSGYFKSLKSIASAHVRSTKYRINPNPDIEGEDNKAKEKKLFKNTIAASAADSVSLSARSAPDDVSEEAAASRGGAAQEIIDGITDEAATQRQALEEATEFTSAMGRSADMSNIATQMEREAIDVEGTVKGIGGKIWGYVNALDLADMVCTTYQVAQTAAVVARTVALTHYVNYAMQLRAVIERTKAGDDTQGDTNFIMNLLNKRDPITGLAFDSTSYAAFLFNGTVSDQPDSLSVLGGQAMIALNMGLGTIHTFVGGGNALQGRSTLKNTCAIVTNIGVQIAATIGGFFTGGIATVGAKITATGFREAVKFGLQKLRETIVKNFGKEAIEQASKKIGEEGLLKYAGSRAWKGFSNTWKSLDGMGKVGIVFAAVSTFGLAYIIDILSGTDVAALITSGPMSFMGLGTGWEGFGAAVGLAAGGAIASFALYNKYRSQIQDEQASYIADMKQEASSQPLDLTTPYSQLGSALFSAQKLIGISASTDILATIKSVATLPLRLPSLGSTAHAADQPTAEEIAQKVGDEYAMESGVARTITGVPYVLFEKTITFAQFLTQFVDSPNAQVTFDGTDETSGEPKFTIKPDSELAQWKEDCRNSNRTEPDEAVASEETYYDMEKCTENRKAAFDDAIRYINQTSPDQSVANGDAGSTDITGAIVDVGLNASGAQTPWGGYKNGEIPLSARTELPFAGACIEGYGRSSKGPNYLHPKATISMIELNRRYKEQFGNDIFFTNCYRDVPEQQRAWDNEPAGYAARPGTSNHGWALAVDIRASRTKKMTYDSAEYKWLMENAYKVGWVNPPSMRQGASGPDEPWHWEYAGSTSGASNL